MLNQYDLHVLISLLNILDELQKALLDVLLSILVILSLKIECVQCRDHHETNVWT